uniref:Acetyl-CoA hydrolase n=1 Tax=Haemonchus contortus TaxID=6289 RepID=A0A7I4Y6J7_HAECO|nr:Acetyl-CoA hydrolase transferase domain containing protein [Haemonchus contortus]
MLSRIVCRAISSEPAACKAPLAFTDTNEITFPIQGREPKVCTVAEAFNSIKSGDNIFVHGIAATPTPLLKGLCEHAKANDLKGIKLHHLHLEGETPWTAPDVKDRIRSNSLFTGGNLREAVNEGIADFNSCFLHEVPMLFRKGAIKVNAAIIHVSEPDANGYCSLGTSVDVSRAGVANADHIIAMVSKNMPRTFGDGVIHSSHIDVLVEEHSSFPLHERHFGKDNEEEQKIGQIIAENLVDNGSTLQMGIGAVPDAALAAMKNHKDLGIHTEMFSDGILDLIACNAITNKKKVIRPGKVVVSFVYGSKKLYKYLDNNPLIEFGDVQWVNDPAIIRQNPKVVAINSAVEVDLTGQVVADSVGKRFLSGFGGQVDFIRGAGIGLDGEGKPIIALPSRSKKGQSKIVPFINEGAGVVTTRSHVHYIVTEYGIAQLWGKNMRQRAYELIKIAHPSKREELEKAAFDRLKVMPSAD